MVKIKSNRDNINLGVLVPKGNLRYFKKKGDILDLTKEEAETFSVETNLESGNLALVGSKEAKADKKANAKKDADNKKAFSNSAPVEDEKSEIVEDEKSEAVADETKE